MNQEPGRLRRHYDLRSALDAVRAAMVEHPDEHALFALHADLLAAQADECHADAPAEFAALEESPSGASAPGVRNLVLQSTPFVHLSSRIASVLSPHRDEWRGKALDVDPSEVLTLARKALDGRIPATDLEPNLLGASVEGALQATLNGLARRSAPSLDLENWRRATCPFCGSRPILAAIEPELGERHLYCLRCGTMWPYRRTGCIQCAQDGRMVYRVTTDPAYRLYECPDCGSYIKTVDLRCLPRPFHPLVEGLLTIGLDVLAAMTTA